MNSKSSLLLSLFAALTLAVSGVNAAPPRGGGHFSGGRHFASMPGRPGMGAWSGQRWHGGNWGGRNWSGRNWHGGNWSGGWRHHHRFGRDVIFIGDFGFPWWWGWGGPWWGWDYPYGYGYGGYGYGDSGYGYGDSGYGTGSGHASQSRVAELQRRLARAGYYRGAIDGVLGPQTRRAIRAYERDHGDVG